MDLVFRITNLNNTFSPTTYLPATIFSVPSYLLFTFTNIVINKIQASIPCIFWFIYTHEILLLIKFCMGGCSNQNICAITTKIESSI